MSALKIVVVVGSLRKDSMNRRFSKALEKLAPAGTTFQHLDIGALPLYNQDDDANQAPAVQQMKKDIAAADGVMFVTPEYNRSIPGVLKNALDNCSRPYGHSAWSGKPAGIVGVSPGAIGSALAQAHLRPILAYLDMPTLGQPEAFVQMKDGLIDANGEIGEASRKFLQGWMDKFIAWVEQHKG